jgi:transposase InsO family protein
MRARLYLAHAEDLASRRIPGFALSEHHDADVAVAALQMAAAVRGGDVTGVIIHSDRDSEYTADLFETACGRLGLRQAMGRVGSCLEHAPLGCGWVSVTELGSWVDVRQAQGDVLEAAEYILKRFDPDSAADDS